MKKLEEEDHAGEKETQCAEDAQQGLCDAGEAEQQLLWKISMRLSTLGRVSGETEW
jgi:hypothetical protein